MRRLLNERELGELLDQAQRDLFRMETLDSYDVGSDGGDFARYVAGEPGPDPARKEPWLARLRADAERGLQNRRVHVLRSPVGDYLRYESEWGYAPNSDAGEEIRILDLVEVAGPRGLIAEDFWVMDNATVVRMHYDHGGRFEGASVAPRWQLRKYRRAAEAAWQVSVPFRDWWAAHPEYHRERVS
jgi:hypothetical protein